MAAFIDPPRKIPCYLKIGIWISKKAAGRDLLPARLLAWYPKVAISSGILEVLVAHQDGKLDKRMLKLVRLQTSFTVACPFCLDMNCHDYKDYGITEKELLALQDGAVFAEASTFSLREKLALEYARLISGSTVAFPAGFMIKLKANFTEREIVILASTTAQVNYWARLLQALGVPPAGFSDHCNLKLPSK
ncbi:MAG TPA: carboxymuconolactone decarboxylase family protein [Smithellaceae bacterium]|nr:carboxymuconolactone decarboxylase family protein [Smithellaceae bacterium]